MFCCANQRSSKSSIDRSATSKLKKLTEENESLRERLEEKERQLKANRERNKMKRLTNKIDEAMKGNNVDPEELASLREKIKEKQKRIQDLTKERSIFQKAAEERKRKLKESKRNLEETSMVKSDLALQIDKLKEQLKTLEDSDKEKIRNLQDKVKNLQSVQDTLESSLLTERRKESELMTKLNSKSKLLEEEKDKEKELQRVMFRTNSRLAELERAKKVFQEYLDVNDAGGHILQGLHEFCAVMVSVRGDKRKREMAALLEEMIRTKGTPMCQSVRGLFDLTNDGDEDTIGKEDMHLFLKVLFIQYPALVGRKIMDRLKEVMAKSTKKMIKDAYMSRYNELQYNVPPHETAFKSAMANIDRTMEKYFKEDGSKVTYNQFVNIVCNFMIAKRPPHKFALFGEYMIEDYGEDVNREMEDDEDEDELDY